ncbi:MAG: TAXI family TRAP transporter solute-binding subunit [Microvirga sp.]
MAFMAVSNLQHPRIRLVPVQADDLAASAKALEEGRTDLSIIRTDVSPPTNGQTIAILRRDLVAIVLPHGSSIDNVAALSGKTVGIPESWQQAYNAQLLDTLLGFFDVPAKNVKRVFIKAEDVGSAVQHKHVAAILAVGPMAAGEVTDVVAAVAKATKGTPTMLAFDEAEAIAKRFPAFESIDVPTGALRARPATPDDTTTTVAVTYRLVGPELMPNVIAGAIGRSVFTTKSQFMAKTPLANQIEAPDPDDKNPILPVHPGVAAYLNSGDQSFFDQFQQYFYLGGIVLSLVGSVVAVVAGYLGRRRSADDWRPIRRLIEIADQAVEAQTPRLTTLEGEVRALVSSVLGSQAHAADADRLSAFSTALAHARHVIERRWQSLGETPSLRNVG